MTTSEALEQLAELQRTMHAYNHASGVIYYDAVTGAPEGGAQGRGETLELLSGVSFSLFANPQVGELLSYLKAHGEEIPPQKRREAEILSREYDNISRIPKAEYAAFNRLINDAGAVWHKAKRENDFASFAPLLEQIVGTLIRFAGYYDKDCDPYDFCLDEYEKGLSKATLDRFFSALREKLVPLLRKVKAAPQIDDSFLHKTYPIAKQREFSDFIMELMGIDRNDCSIGETEHPFTTNFNKHDVRITTKYVENQVASSLYSVVHEGGHALYELHTGDELAGTCLATGTSMSIHESQSRLFENLIGRSEAFTDRLFERLVSLFPEQLAGVTARDFYRAVNRCEPSLIRTEADELTYSLHIMVRYDIEKQLFSGEIGVADLPRVWNEKMEEYLGITAPNDTAGVLQDSHWSGGSFGYFPSYAIGSAYAAQIMAAMKRELDVDGLVREGNLSPITGWLTERIYRYGKAKDPEELLLIATGEPFNPDYYTDYLTEKFTALYGLK